MQIQLQCKSRLGEGQPHRSPFEKQLWVRGSEGTLVSCVLCIFCFRQWYVFHVHFSCSWSEGFSCTVQSGECHSIATPSGLAILSPLFPEAPASPTDSTPPWTNVMCVVLLPQSGYTTRWHQHQCLFPLGQGHHQTYPRKWGQPWSATCACPTLPIPICQLLSSLSLGWATLSPRLSVVWPGEQGWTLRAWATAAPAAPSTWHTTQPANKEEVVFIL